MSGIAATISPIVSNIPLYRQQMEYPLHPILRQRGEHGHSLLVGFTPPSCPLLADACSSPQVEANHRCPVYRVLCRLQGNTQALRKGLSIGVVRMSRAEADTRVVHNPPCFVRCVIIHDLMSLLSSSYATQKRRVVVVLQKAA